MTHAYPVYTIEAECQDCYKCVRHCPVKAIRVRDGHAAVIPELCVACGKCVEVCPVKAKQVRNGTGRLRLLLSEPAPVYASLAPSWVSEFKNVTSGQLIRALKQLGFAGVSETALGAQLVSAQVARELDGGVTGLLLSSACPTAVDFVRKYLPPLAGCITPVGSPLMAHARMLRNRYGDGIRVVFVEMLACPGGCVHGPCAEHDSPGLLERLRVLRHTRWPDRPRERSTSGSIHAEFSGDAVAAPVPAGNDIVAALRSIGKTRPEDELNCDGCGYDTCRNFAQALLSGHAEPSMCVSYLKKQAQKKANALLRSISSGVVIADKKLQIIECNRNFAELFGADTVEAFDACPGLAGADLSRIVPFYALFESSLQSGRDVRRDSLKCGKRLFNVNIFNIEPGEVIGAVMFDVTSTELRREQIAARAREVIDRNLATVQEIACRLGEQMADTELLLRSIADDYADETLIPPEPPPEEQPL